MSFSVPTVNDPQGGNVHLVIFPSTSPTASVVIPAALGGKTLLLPRSQSSVILPAQVNSAAPVLGPLPVAPISTWQPNVLSLADALPVSKPLISISGQSFHPLIQSEDVFQQSYSHLQSIRKVFAPEVFESAALDFVQNFDWSEDILSRDCDLLRSLGSLDNVLEHFSAQHRAAGMNEERVRLWLSAEPRLQLLLAMVNDGGE
eukprot:gene7860-10633_t